jgi:hypothetical protein
MIVILTVVVMYANGDQTQRFTAMDTLPSCWQRAPTELEHARARYHDAVTITAGCTVKDGNPA